MNSFYSQEELCMLGFASVGVSVLISRNAKLYGIESMHIGNYVRIDDFCILSGNVCIGSYVHIAAATLLFAGHTGIEIKDYSTISSRCAIYAITDDYSGESMTNPTIPDKYRGVIDKKVVIEKHVIVGTGSTILPGVVIGEGDAFGAMSLINQSTKPWGIYVGVPCRRIKDRKKELLKYERFFGGMSEVHL